MIQIRPPRQLNLKRRAQKKALSTINALGYTVVETIPHDMEPAFIELYWTCRPYTMTPITRMYALYQAVRYLDLHDVPGAIVECGVWRGGSMMLAAMTLQQIGANHRDLMLFDTYEGQPAPTEHDVTFTGSRATDRWNEATTAGTLDPEAIPAHLRALASLDEVRANLQATGYPMDRVTFVQGLVEETIPEQAPHDIALLRLDTDWYASTSHELRHLYPRVSDGGVVIIDDYGFWQGAKAATDAYFQEHRIPMLLQRIDDSGRIGITRDPLVTVSHREHERRR